MLVSCILLCTCVLEKTVPPVTNELIPRNPVKFERKTDAWKSWLCLKNVRPLKADANGVFSVGVKGRWSKPDPE